MVLFLQVEQHRKELVMPQTSFFTRVSSLTLFTACAWLPLVATDAAAASSSAFLPKFHVSSTIPMNGDLNPYGVAFVPPGFPGGGLISPGDVVVSNFNDTNNCQGRGTTIIQFTPNNAAAPEPAVPAGAPGNATTFFSSSQFGLSTALGVLKGGFVIVGNVAAAAPAPGPVCSAMALPGVLQVIDRNGNLVATLADNSPGGFIYGSPSDRRQ
jgi:hypothetical protein